MLGFSGPKQIEVLNQLGASVPYRAIVQIRPRAYSRFTAIDAPYEMIRMQPGTAAGGVALLGVVTSRQGIGDDEKGSVAVMGGPLSATISAHATAVNGISGVPVSQYDVLAVVSQGASSHFTAGATRFRKWPRNLTASTVNFSVGTVAITASTLSLNQSTIGAASMTGSVIDADSFTATSFSRLVENVNHLRALINKLAGDTGSSISPWATQVVNNITTIATEHDQMVTNVSTLAAAAGATTEYARRVRAIYIGTTVLTASNATGDVILINNPLID